MTYTKVQTATVRARAVIFYVNQKQRISFMSLTLLKKSTLKLRGKKMTVITKRKKGVTIFFDTVIYELSILEPRKTRLIKDCKRL